MEKIITEIAGKFIRELINIVSEGGSFAQIEPIFHREAKNCAAQIMSVYAESVDRAVLADKSARREAGYRVERRVPELHIDADEDHITLRGGRKSEVPLISIYEGIEKHGKRNSCKNVFHISEYGKTPDDLWEQALTEIEQRYDLTDTKVYLHGDGGNWIQKGLEWLPKAIFVLDKYHKNKAIQNMTAGLSFAGRRLFDRAIRQALIVENTEVFNRLTVRLCHTLPGRVKTILDNAEYLKKFIAGISICTKDSGANNGGCTEPHVSHILSARLSSRPMAWSRQTLQVGLPAPDAIGTLPLSGKVTGTQKLLKLFT